MSDGCESRQLFAKMLAIPTLEAGDMVHLCIISQFILIFFCLLLARNIINAALMKHTLCLEEKHCIEGNSVCSPLRPRHY